MQCIDSQFQTLKLLGAKAGDNQGALTHLSAADQGLTSSSDQSAKMHLDEGIKAVKSGDQQGALMHLGVADQALGGSGQ